EGHYFEDGHHLICAVHQQDVNAGSISIIKAEMQTNYHRDPLRMKLLNFEGTNSSKRKKLVEAEHCKSHKGE
ncbi:hypothetical protein HAX54_045810, partial [Datura stramonium]|nr:hypothetical protein [Datura stramonium]